MIQSYGFCTDAFLFTRSDSAPHPIIAKRGGVKGKSRPPAGVFIQLFATQYVILALEEAGERGVIKEEDVTQERLEQFLGGFDSSTGYLILRREIGLCSREKVQGFRRALRVRITASKLRYQEAELMCSV